jgi:hypothetical protein
VFRALQQQLFLNLFYSLNIRKTQKKKKKKNNKKDFLMFSKPRKHQARNLAS